MNEHDDGPSWGPSSLSYNPSHHQQAQSHGAVRRALEQILACADDDRLAEATLLHIHPRSGGRRLTVLLTGTPQHVLDRAESWVRTELANELSRRRVPLIDLISLDGEVGQ